MPMDFYIWVIRAMPPIVVDTDFPPFFGAAHRLSCIGRRGAGAGRRRSAAVHDV